MQVQRRFFVWMTFFLMAAACVGAVRSETINGVEDAPVEHGISGDFERQ